MASSIETKETVRPSLRVILTSGLRCLLALALTLSLPILHLQAREKDAAQYGMGLIINVPFPESEVVEVVRDVIQNGIIRGTKEYNKDEYIEGAAAATSTPVFKEETDGGQVFYKVRLKVLDPRNFKDASDVGTLAVRYVVQAQGDKNTVLRIEARFVEDFRHIAHASDGSVESAEYKEIHDRLDALQLMKVETADAKAEKGYSHSEKQPNRAGSSAAVLSPSTETSGPVSTDAREQSQPQTLEQHVQDLRRQVERRVKAPGAPLKSAPFHTATVLQSLPAGTEVLIVISTTYWFGVETHEGQHGWILRDDLEFLP